jgi:hypothetical protein
VWADRERLGVCLVLCHDGIFGGEGEDRLHLIYGLAVKAPAPLSTGLAAQSGA